MHEQRDSSGLECHSNLEAKVAVKTSWKRSKPMRKDPNPGEKIQTHEIKPGQSGILGTKAL